VDGRRHADTDHPGSPSPRTLHFPPPSAGCGGLPGVLPRGREAPPICSLTSSVRLGFSAPDDDDQDTGRSNLAEGRGPRRAGTFSRTAAPLAPATAPYAVAGTAPDVLRCKAYKFDRLQQIRHIHGEPACTATGRCAERPARRLKMGVEIDVLGDESPGWKDELTHQSCNRLAL